MGKLKVILGIIIFIIIVGMITVPMSFVTVKSGHVGVGTLFGKVQNEIYNEGFNWKNPLVKITEFDARQKTYKDTMGVPSKDQLITDFDLSVQYRLIKSMAPSMLKETGSPKDVVDIHMLPYMRSLTREIGKSVEKAELFFDQTEQARVQEELLTRLTAVLTTKGIKIEKLLVRDVRLPKLITNAVEEKKKVAQAAEKAKEDLKKFRIDQEQKEAKALADKRAEIIQAEKEAAVAKTIAEGKLVAAEIDAKATLVAAEAEAKAKRKVIDVIGIDAYVRLENAKVLPALAEGNHIIMMDPEGNNMLPFMNLDKMIR